MVQPTNRAFALRYRQAGPFVLSLSKHERAVTSRHSPFDKLRANGFSAGPNYYKRSR